MRAPSVVLINPNSPIKEFTEEQEPEERKCIICAESAPEEIPTRDMQRMKKGRWYSNALLNPKTRAVKRFYLCPAHLALTQIAWTLTREEAKKQH